MRVGHMAAAAACGLLLATPAAFAQQQQPSQQHQTQQHQAQPGAQAAHEAIQQRIRQDLEKAGYKDVRVMPESFLVRAHDPQNRPVMMIVNPDSVTAITELGSPGQQGAGGNAQHGSASGQTQNQGGNAGTSQQNR
ncbi:MAG: hypothetical protein ICV73_15910 [Acetobacteraceae bacterium]|nr:hypothetical protein [Acetobacteraceae bacterium]